MPNQCSFSDQSSVPLTGTAAQSAHPGPIRGWPYGGLPPSMSVDTIVSAASKDKIVSREDTIVSNTYVVVGPRKIVVVPNNRAFRVAFLGGWIVKKSIRDSKQNEALNDLKKSSRFQADRFPPSIKLMNLVQIR